MMKLRLQLAHAFRVLACGCVLGAQPFALWAADAGNASSNPSSYALRLPVQLSPQAQDAPLQRLLLPARALVNLQSPAYSDVRIFNGQGQPVPIALSSVAPAQAERQKTRLAAYPIVGAADSGAGSIDGMSLRIEEREGSRVVRIDTGTGAQASAAKGGAQKTWGVLLDARAVAQPVAAIALDVDIPVGQPITFSLQASRDLKTWRPLGDTVLFRNDSTSAGLGSAGFDLPLVDLKDNYLRLTWADTAGQMPAVTVRSATLTTEARQAGLARRDRVQARIAAPALAGPHELSFSLPFATPVAALHIVPQGDNVLIPLRVLGRKANGQPWAPLATTVVYKLGAAGKLQSNSAVELPASGFRDIKLEADKKTPGFAAPPEVTVQFEPVQVVFVASGAGPYTLAVGLAQEANAYLPLQSLMPGYKPGQEDTLPFANVVLDATGKSAPALVDTAAVTDATPTRSIVLWGVLLAAVAALGLMAWVLLKQGKDGATAG